MGINIVAVLWGFAEATLFFIVPDVWLSIVARNKLKAALLACLFALLGAMAGGVLMYYWGAQQPTQAQIWIEKIPAIDMAMIERVHQELVEQGLLAIVLGPLSGTPYKVYAIESASAGISFWAFMLISIPARLFRFVSVTLLAHYALKAARDLGINAHSLLLLAIAWFINYVIYFSLMGF